MKVKTNIKAGPQQGSNDEKRWKKRGGGVHFKTPTEKNVLWKGIAKERHAGEGRTFKPAPPQPGATT